MQRVYLGDEGFDVEVEEGDGRKRIRTQILNGTVVKPSGGEGVVIFWWNFFI